MHGFLSSGRSWAAVHGCRNSSRASDPKKQQSETDFIATFNYYIESDTPPRSRNVAHLGYRIPSFFNSFCTYWDKKLEGTKLVNRTIKSDDGIIVISLSYNRCFLTSVTDKTKCRYSIQMWLPGREAISKENVCNSAHQYTVDSILHANSLLDLKDRRLKLIQEPNGFILCWSLFHTCRHTW